MNTNNFYTTLHKQNTQKKKSLQKLEGNYEKRFQKTFKDLLKFLQENIPEEIRKEVEDRFDFTNTKNTKNHKFHIRSFVRDVMYSPFGSAFVNIPEEIIAPLNSAWKDVIHIDPSSRSIILSNLPEIIVNIKKDKINRLKETQRRIQKNLGSIRDFALKEKFWYLLFLGSVTMLPVNLQEDVVTFFYTNTTLSFSIPFFPATS